MNWQGIAIGAISFLTIGLFHPVVIKGEYYFGSRIWPVFLVSGLIAIGLSLFVRNTTGSAALGVLGFSCLWSIGELFHQVKRVERGWFPKNPDRKDD